MDRRWADGCFGRRRDGAIVFSPLAQGILTNRYLNGIPSDSRAARSDSRFLSAENVEPTIQLVTKLNVIAQQRNQTLAEMALAWNLRQQTVASVLIGASRLSQLEDNLKALDNLDFSKEELKKLKTHWLSLQGKSFKYVLKNEDKLNQFEPVRLNRWNQFDWFSSI